jgi:hypothetical protein
VLLSKTERAEIAPAKIRDYLLSSRHAIGRFKARGFKALGFSALRWQELERALREQHLTQEARPSGAAAYGQKYTVRAILKGPSGESTTIVSVWLIPTGGDIPRFVTAYPGERPVNFQLLDVVVLDRDIPDSGLKRGDLGAVVDISAPDAIEVEFVTASGRTQALVALQPSDLRSVADTDLVATRQTDVLLRWPES